MLYVLELIMWLVNIILIANISQMASYVLSICKSSMQTMPCLLSITVTHEKAKCLKSMQPVIMSKGVIKCCSNVDNYNT